MSRTRSCVLPVTALLLSLAAAGCGGTTSEARAPDAPGGATVVEREAEDTNLTIEELIQRRAPGVQIHRSGSDVSVVIRGQGTLGGQTNALVVIDGLEQASPASILSLSAMDVVRVEVLKDASAARYGVRGANGVLVITTRRSR